MIVQDILMVPIEITSVRHMERIRNLLLVTLEDSSNPRSSLGIPFSLRWAQESYPDQVAVVDRLSAIPQMLQIAYGF